MSTEQRILIVDDYDANLVSLEAVLDSDEWHIVSARSGKEALSILIKDDISLVVLDVQMPEMDGFEVAAMMQKNKKTKDIPVIFLTAISKEEKYIYKGYQLGAADYLCKPVNPTILRSKVDFYMKLVAQKQMLGEQIERVKMVLDAEQAQEQVNKLAADTGKIVERELNQAI